MDKKYLYCAGSTAAARYAAEFLVAKGQALTGDPREAGAVLLDVPSFTDDGCLRGGASVTSLLENLPKDITVFGGKLDHSALKEYRRFDLLADEEYVAQNAYITAECALQVAAQQLPITFRDCSVLIIGWGRIGKCLAKLLSGIGAGVTVAARKETDRAMICALGHRAVGIPELTNELTQSRLIFNTVPHIVLTSEQMQHCHPDCVKIDLASKPGMLCEGVIRARGLPGIHAPESSGKQIAQTIIRLSKGDYS